MKQLFIACTTIWWPLLILVLTGCQQIPGTVTVYQKISLYYDGIGSNDQASQALVYSLAAGSYQGIITWVNHQEAYLTLPKMPVFRFALRGAARFPTAGTFIIKPEQNNQDREIHGKIITKVVDGPKIQGHEPCQYVRYDSICDETGCYLRRQIFDGQREVEYCEQTTQSNSVVKIFDDEGSDVAMAFAGKVRSVKKKYLSQGKCLKVPIH